MLIKNQIHQRWMKMQILSIQNYLIDLYRELKDRINHFDAEALSIMIAAKQRVKKELEYYEDTIKYVALALKPFYIVCLVSISIQSPELV